MVTPPATITSGHPTQFWRPLPDGRLECTLCPRLCRLRPGQRGLCYVRANDGNGIVLTTYGRSSGFCVDPIEKKPLNHFFPGSSVLSFGTAGCNLACRFCQNWDISKARSEDALAAVASPEAIAETGRRLACRSVAFTYNDPVIFHEYAVDTAQACREAGIKTVAVTAGYVRPEPRDEFYRYMDAANIDLKAFTNRFYEKLCGGRLEPVLDTIRYVARETDVWLEVTTLLIPGENDSEAELDKLTSWLREEAGPDVPLHFTAYHPDWKMREHPPTRSSALMSARNIAIRNGLRYAYTGNIRDLRSQTTYCHRCGSVLIGRDGYDLFEWNLSAEGRCGACGTRCSGVFERVPGAWGGRRLSVAVES